MDLIQSAFFQVDIHNPQICQIPSPIYIERCKYDLSLKDKHYNKYLQYDTKVLACSKISLYFPRGKILKLN